jgi:hypothetical protein
MVVVLFTALFELCGQKTVSFVSCTNNTFNAPLEPGLQVLYSLFVTLNRILPPDVSISDLLACPVISILWLYKFTN